MFGLGVPELMFIMLLALLIFGPKRLPQIGRTLGKGMAEFRRASTELQRSINLDLEPDPEPPRPAAAASPSPVTTAAASTEPATEPTTEATAEPATEAASEPETVQPAGSAPQLVASSPDDDSSPATS